MVDGHHPFDLGAAGVAVYLRDGTDKVIAILSKDLELLVGMLPEDGGRLPDRGLCHAAAAARSGGARGRQRIRPARPAGRDDDGRGAAAAAR